MNRYSKYFAIESRIREKGFDPDRHDLIGSFTADEKHSLKSLTETEYREFLAWLTTKFDIHNKSNKETNKKMDIMRKKLIAIYIHQMGYSYHGLDNFLLTKGVVKKTLNNLNYSDLVKSISQAERVYQSHLNQLT